FEDCHLNIISFYKLKLKNTKFNKCKLQEVDFTETDLSNASFNNCDLIGSIFNATILEKADFRTSYNYSIDPEINRIKKARFSLQGIVGLLGKYQIEIE
ncbi:MAG: pentapeptide repeat-containing protein, partial [Lutibacter sp.]|nr:pentapeptide repeat-containing protein [Lutibacter sp.]